MLFDLQGSRKTAVKVIYLGLAILMAGGLILFGIGSSTSGGLADVLTGGGGNNLEKQVKKSQEAYQKNPKNMKVLQQLIVDRYNWAGDKKNYNPSKRTFSKEGKAQLHALTKDWLTYKKSVKNPDVNTASYAVSAYLGLEDAKGAQKAQEIVTNKRPDAANYLELMQLALYAGDTLTASGAEIKARSLATKDQQKEVEATIKKVKKQVAQRSADIQKQIQEQFAQQQKQSGGGAPNNPFGQ